MKTVKHNRHFDTQDAALEDLGRQYTTLGHPIAFAGQRAIYDWYLRKLSRKTISSFLASVEGYTLHREVRRSKRNPIYLYAPRWRMEIDLLDVSQMKNENDGKTFLVMLIDCWTRFLWVEPIVNKSANIVLTAVMKMFTSVGETPKYLGGDRGTEFLNRKMQKFCRDNGVTYTPNYNYTHAPFVERANRTLQKILYTWMSENETSRYIDVLQKVVQSYNNRTHRITRMSPHDAEKPRNHVSLRLNMEDYYLKFKKQSTRFEVGEYVRIAKQKGHFARSYDEQFSREVLRIQSVNKKLPIPTYTLTSYDGSEDIKGNFYAHELTLVKNTSWRVEKVLKTRRKRGRTEHLVKWKGFSSDYNSWIRSEDIVARYGDK